jgi:hypothetical protein
MKLPNFLDWAELNALRLRMGALELGDVRLTPDPNRLTEAELERLVHGGLDVSGNDVRVLPDGTLAYKDSRVLVYIRDVSSYKQARDDGLPRFHLANCDTLQQMRRDNRYERYVVAARQDGLFEVNFIEQGRAVRSSPERLRVCQNCLGMLAFDGFRRDMSKAARERKVAQFRLEDFFKKYPRALFLQTPANRSDSGPLNVYPADFEELSKRIKDERGWRCEGSGCGVVLSDRSLRRYLHLHHANGLKYDSRPENLILLCLVCHAEEPLHSHMKRLPEYEAFRRIRERLMGVVPRRSTSGAVPTSAHEVFSEQALQTLADEHGLVIRDFRAKKGALWVELAADQAHLTSRLKAWGFKHKEGRGWWRSSQK